MLVAVLTNKIMFYFLILISLENVFAQLPPGEVHARDESNMCTVKWDSCKLKMSDFSQLGPGEKGDTGPRGLPGPVGPPGLNGLPGSCSCQLTPKEKSYDKEDVKDFKLPENDRTCNLAPEGLESGNYTTQIPSGMFDIYCNMTTRETCIRRNSKTPAYEYSAENGTFWLSRAGINLRDIYELTTQQISWLQDMSSSVRQTLKYHCLDSVPYPKFNTSSAVKLLTWNDVIIEPYPTKDSPFFYSVSPETDGCVEGASTWNSTIIEIRSTNANRLPITDVWIKDVRGKSQKMYIESIELCFG